VLLVQETEAARFDGGGGGVGITGTSSTGPATSTVTPETQQFPPFGRAIHHHVSVAFRPSIETV